MHWIPTPPLIGHQGNSLFRALVGCRMVDSVSVCLVRLEIVNLLVQDPVYNNLPVLV